jgi:hypothetical protein
MTNKMYLRTGAGAVAVTGSAEWNEFAAVNPTEFTIVHCAHTN